MPMPIRSGQRVARVDALHRRQHFARRGDRVLRGVGRLERRAEQRQKSVAEKLVHDAAMAVENFHQHRERAVEPVDHLLRRARPRACGETAEIDEHHGDVADVAGGIGALDQQPLDHLRRDVLAEQVGDAIARGRGRDAGRELPAQLNADRAGQYPADQDDHAARGMIPDVGRGIGQSRRGDRTSPSPNSSVAATKPVKVESQKSSRSVERMMKMK